MPGVAATELELDLAGRDVQLVMRHQDLLRCNLEEARQRCYGFARHVHESLGLEKPDRLPAHGGAAHQAVIAFFHRQRGFQLTCKCVHPPKPCIVAGGLIVWPWVAESDKKSDHFWKWLTQIIASKENGP